MAWGRKGSKEEDEMYSEAADTLIKAACDADMVNKIELATGRNIREQITEEELLDLDLERRLRRFNGRN